MKRTASYFWVAPFLALFVTLSPCHLVTLSSYGQESPYAEDLRFVRELRNHGYTDLAREYLDKLAKNAPAALKKELPLEIALTEMEAANDEPDSNMRIKQYAQAREQFQEFLKANPNHPRAAETKLDIARATTLQGKTQLSRALLEDDLKARIAAGDKARKTLIAAFNDLKKLPETPQTKLAMALNLLDQSETYLNTGSEAATGESIKRIQEAREILDQLAQGEPNSKITWQARAWAGHCLEMLDDPKGAIKMLNAVTTATGPAAQDGKRLAVYFTLLASKKLDDTSKRDLIRQATRWLQRYPSYKRTPEGLGVQYWLAHFLLEEAADPKNKRNPRLQEQYATLARKYLSNIEQTENEFTDRAKRLKIDAMAKQGTFERPISSLRTFEDCFVRAQYEQMQIAEDAKEAKDDKTAEEKRKKRIANILQALQAGLKKLDAVKKRDAKEPSLQENQARALLTFYLLEQGKTKEAVAFGEAFARKDKHSSQAASAAIYALVAYGQLLAERKGKAADLRELQRDPAYQEEKGRMLSLARFMEERWPKERAGDLARHEIALHLLREDKNAEAIKELAAITPAYPSYIRTQYLLARAALQQAAEDARDKQGYHKRALAALSKLPGPAKDADIETNSDYIQAKQLLALELVKAKKLKEVDAVLAALAPKLKSLKVDNDADKEKEKRRKFEASQAQLSLYSAALQADSNFKAGKYKEVTQRLDPLLDKFAAGQLPQLTETGLGPSVIGMDLRANVQLNNMKRARAAIKALQVMQSENAEKGADNTTAILAQLVNLITRQVEELRKKGDADSLKKAQAGFTTILNEVVGGKKKLTPNLAYLLARCYAGMDNHKKAVELLKKFTAEGEDKDAPLHHALQLLLVQELRQLKEIDEARKLLDDILKGWGAKSIGAQKAHVLQLEAEEKYAAAALLCDKFVKQLVRRLDDNQRKKYYFEFYYHLVYCILKHGQGLDDAAKKAKAVHDAAQRIVKLEKGHDGFGSEASKKRFDELLEKETELREQYNALKERR